MEDIKVKKEKRILTVEFDCHINLKAKNVFKRAKEWEEFEPDLLNLLIAIISRKLTPKSFYLKSVVISIISSTWKSQMSSGLGCAEHFAAVNSPCPTGLPV